jgi:CDP-diacylglycerol--serine O-phosphatidyltransferase
MISLADLMSILNASCGFSSILLTFFNNFYYAFSFILLAIIFDGMDGVIARKIRHGDLGEYLEAMADMTSLGIAPAIFIYMVYQNIGLIQEYHFLLLLIIYVYLISGIVRLASFHIIKDERYFVGLPASVGAIMIVTTALFRIDVLYVILLTFFISIGMISNIRFPKLGVKSNIIAGFLLLITIIFGRNYYNFAPLILTVAILCYIIVGPLYLHKIDRKTLDKYFD